MPVWRNCVCVAALCLPLVACGGEPIAPAVVPPRTALDPDDVAVMRAVLDGLRERDPETRRFLVVDSTVPFCSRPSDVFRAPPGGCLGPQAIDRLSQVLPSGTRLTAMGTFRQRNVGGLPISGSLGADVTYISPTLVDFMPLNELLKQHPGGAVVSFSAPAHVAPGTAVVVYQVMAGEYVAERVTRAADGHWRVSRQPRSGERP